MKSWQVVAITWVILQFSIWASDSIRLDLVKPTKAKYAKSLSDIRNNVKDPKLKYGGTKIPVIGAPTQTFLRVDLKVKNGTVSLGLKRSDLYVVAYLAKNNESEFRAYHYDNITSTQLDELFPEAMGAAKQQKITEYKENYASIESAAEVTRKTAGLGIGKLVRYIGNVNGKARHVKDEAKFMLVGIQMVSEAARFKYIQHIIQDNLPNGFTPNDSVPILQRNWGRISKAIKINSTKGVFPAPLVLTSPEIKTKWTVNNAGELNMGILKYLGS